MSKEQSCRNNGHLAQWCSLGSIAIDAANNITKTINNGESLSYWCSHCHRIVFFGGGYLNRKRLKPDETSCRNNTASFREGIPRLKSLTKLHEASCRDSGHLTQWVCMGSIARDTVNDALSFGGNLPRLKSTAKVDERWRIQVQYRGLGSVSLDATNDTESFGGVLPKVKGHGEWTSL